MKAEFIEIKHTVITYIMKSEHNETIIKST